MSPTRYATLDHLRGFAALWVVLFHACTRWTEPAQPPLTWLHAFGGAGWFGVHVFFVISGYCITERAARHVAEGRTARSFLLDRARRIFPAYWAALALAVILAVIATPFNGLPLIASPGSYGALPASPWAALTHVTLTSPLFAIQPYLLVAWTLSCEIAFYLLVSLGLLGIGRGQPAFIMVLAGYTLAFLQSASWVDLPGTLLDLWPEFMCGVLAWQALLWRPRKPLVSIAAWLGILALALLGHGFGSPAGTLPGSAAFALTLIVLKRYDAPLAQSRLIGGLGLCGAFSYSLYLVHVPFISPLQNLIHRIHPDAHHQAWIPILLVACSLLPAWLFHRWIEKPAERWRRRHDKASVIQATPLAVTK
jgi:exopolysaccharide production protein ExoZ